MSIQAVAWALEQDLPARPKLVLVAIANHANHEDGYCWLKAETIAREAACTPRSVFNFVGALIRNGFIRKELRRSQDGKQRANDYWILFDREEKPWEVGALPEADEVDGEAIETATAEDLPQNIVVPHEPRACGENTVQHERHNTRQPVEMSPGSSGPHASTFMRKSLKEPSESNSKESSACARVRSRAPRSYKPPPPQPLGEVINNAKDVFVFDGTDAYEAWARHMARKNGLRTWHLTTRKLVEGKGWRSGWYFPTLFPPADSSRSPNNEARPPPIPKAS